MSVFDSSMRVTMNIQDESLICADFLGSVTMASGGNISLRIVVDNQFYSTDCGAGILGVPAVTLTFPVQLRVLTDALPAGEHTIDVQFVRLAGAPTLKQRSFYVTEITSP
jgi:hypothetical protein